MRSAPALAFALVPPLLALTACMADDKRYPSLLPRPIESQSVAEPVVQPAVAAPDPALDKRIGEVTAGLDAAQKAFVSAAQNAEAAIAVARGVPQGSEAWLNAQIALSEAEAKRAPIVAALTDLEQIAIERGEAGKPPYPALDKAIARADALSQEQSARLAGLEAALAGN